ncbi:MAG: hypothetical protein KGI29_09235 [Pseudomonadota bacterium]|nr:hypothetical protein [Pseudomonadota bacterium]MDE3037361.1 hypothetical protein [Pseudomonadota bacterium]
MQNQAQTTKEYLESMRAIEAMMKRLRNDSAKMFTDNPKTVHWGHVGDMRRIEIKVKELSDLVFQEGEYAN